MIRHGCCLLRKADAHNVPLFDSSLHKNLIYTLRSSSASLLIFTRTCVFCCVVTDQHNYATGKNDTVSPPQSPLSALTVSVSRAHLISTTIKPPTMVPSVDMVSRRTRGKLRIEGMNSFDCKVINSVLLQFWNCIYAGGRTL